MKKREKESGRHAAQPVRPHSFGSRSGADDMDAHSQSISARERAVSRMSRTMPAAENVERSGRRTERTDSNAFKIVRSVKGTADGADDPK